MKRVPKFIQRLARAVFTSPGSGLKDWKVEIGVPPSECIDELKLIRISESYLGKPWYYQKEIFLHEVAHVGHREHDAEFYFRYAALLNEWAHFDDHSIPGLWTQGWSEATSHYPRK